jgi:hypothetical protein
MKRTYKYALSVVLSLGLVGVTTAQESFPDVQDSHWAADAIKRLKGLTFLQGMPNGNFEGGRNITRYEMASLVYAVYAKLVCFNEEVDVRIKKLEGVINNTKVEGSAPDYSDIKSALSALKSDIGTIKSWGSDIQMLRKMSDSYKKELEGLGVDVSEMKKQLNATAARVKALEAKTDAVSVSGDVNFWTAAGLKQDGFASGINQDGRFAQGNANGAGLDTLTVLHELGLKLGNGAASDTHWGAELVLGNMLSNGVAGFGDQASQFAGVPYGRGGNTALYLNRAWVHLPQYNAIVGRQGLKLGKFIAQRFDNTSFFENERYDNGEFGYDGASINLGPAKAFIGVMNNMRTSSGGNVQPVIQNILGLERVMGVSSGFKIGDKGNVDVSYVNFDSDTPGVNRLEVYGADMSYDFNSFMLTAGIGKSAAKFNNNTVNNTDNARWNVAANFKTGSVNMNVGIQRVEDDYAAPGDWGRVGIFRNLTGYTTTFADGDLKLSEKLGVFGNYAKLKEISGNDEIDTYRAGVNYALTSKWNMMGSYETTTADGVGNPHAKFVTFGLGYDMGANKTFKLWYQNSDLQNFVTVPGLGASQKGGFVAAQFSFRF